VLCCYISEQGKTERTTLVNRPRESFQAYSVAFPPDVGLVSLAGDGHKARGRELDQLFPRRHGECMITERDAYAIVFI
jgi:hypothetical protein